MPSSEHPGVQTPLRTYQRAALEQYQEVGGLIVVLPTGAGKTLIAAAAAAHTFGCASAAGNEGHCVLFLVPTILLVEQQAAALEAETQLRIVRYHGEMDPPSPGTFDALVSTPAAFIALAAHDTRLALQTFSLLIFDEVHHVIKKHPYRKVARLLQVRLSCCGHCAELWTLGSCNSQVPKQHGEASAGTSPGGEAAHPRPVCVSYLRCRTRCARPRTAAHTTCAVSDQLVVACRHVCVSVCCKETRLRKHRVRVQPKSSGG